MHWSVLSAADFFTVEVMALSRLQRYLVLVIVEKYPRRVTIGGYRHSADGLMNSTGDPRSGRIRGWGTRLVHPSSRMLAE